MKDENANQLDQLWERKEYNLDLFDFNGNFKEEMLENKLIRVSREKEEL